MRVTTALLVCAFVSGCSVGGGRDQTDFDPATYSPYTYKTGPAAAAAGVAYNCPAGGQAVVLPTGKLSCEPIGTVAVTGVEEPRRGIFARLFGRR
ncbi:MAG: hypothetical protein AAF092_09925 [Pseudomonadota bacterium]